MKIRSQIILAQVPTAIIIFLITLFFIFALTTIEYKSKYILVDNLKNILSMQRLNESLEELNTYIIHHPKIFDDQIKKDKVKIEQELFFQEKLTIETNEEEALIQSLRKKWEAYKNNIMIQSPDNKAEESYKELKQTIGSIINLNQDALIRKKNDLSNFIIDYRLFISTFSLISLIFGFFMSWIFTGLFLTPLNKMIEIVSQFGKTDETILLHIKGSEEIEKLSEEFNLMTNRLEAYHQSTFGHIIENYEILKGALDTLPDPLLLFNHNNDIIFMNHTASHLFSISGTIKEKNPLLYLENNLKESLLKIVKKEIVTKRSSKRKPKEETISILNKNKKISFFPLVYTVKNVNNINNSHSAAVLIILQDRTRQTLLEKDNEEIYRTFIHDFQAPLTEIQIALFASLQETIGPLTEKQKEILYAAQEKCEELENLYQDFRKISEIDKKE